MLPFPFSVALPGAGGNWQTIDTRWWSPNLTMNFAGDPAIEREINEEVATYGRQIGWLNDIVAALVEADGKAAIAKSEKATKSFNKLETARRKIEAIKQRKAANALDEARDAMVKLAKEDAPAYRRLLRLLDNQKTSARDSGSSTG
jgi:hypothetical protein